MNLINVDKNGNDIPIRIFKDEKGKYTTAISKKIGEEYQNKYFPVEFLKDVDLPNGIDIIIKHAFMTWFEWEFEGKTGTKFIMKITAFEKVDNGKPVLRPDPKLDAKDNKISSAKEIELDDDELPFY